MVKSGAERSTKFSEKHDPDVIMLRLKALQNFSIDKFQIPAQQSYLVDNNLSRWLQTEDLKYGQRGTCYDFLRSIVWKWDFLTDWEKETLHRQWLAKGLPQTIWDKIDAKHTEIMNTFYVCAYPTGKLFSHVSYGETPVFNVNPFKPLENPSINIIVE